MKTTTAISRCRRYCGEPYSGRRFPGYEDIDLSFEELETLVKNDRADWKAALDSTKGIYLISDTLTGKR